MGKRFPMKNDTFFYGVYLYSDSIRYMLAFHHHKTSWANKFTIGSNVHHLLPELPCRSPALHFLMLFTVEHNATLKHCF